MGLYGHPADWPRLTGMVCLRLLSTLPSRLPSLQWSVLWDAILAFGGGYGGVDTEQVGFPVYLEGGTLISSQGSPARPGAKT